MPLIESNDYFLIPKRKTQKTLGAILIVIAVIVTLQQVWLPWLGYALVTNDPLQQADAIIVLGGGNGDRERTGARLYKEGYAPLVVTTGEPLKIPSIDDTPFAKFSADYLKKLGVPETAILQLPQSTSTCDDARLTLASLPSGIKRIIVVSDPFHTRRSQLIFNGRFKNQVEVIMTAASPSWFDPSRWWMRENGMIAVGSEYLKLISTATRGCGT
jgi:uncharacterized SAM-binding protein YcdF (DUF218 family)